jgi:hypothetical protein
MIDLKDFVQYFVKMKVNVKKKQSEGNKKQNGEGKWTRVD